jgi:hypothetical protein
VKEKDIVPNFLVVGAAKSGTTWLYYCLKDHPEVFVSIPKELNFFSKDSNFTKGPSWYQEYFKDVQGEVAIGEISPSYMFPPEIPSRIYDWNPHVKIIFILRNPIERAYSDFCMNLDHGIFTGNVDQELSKDKRIVQQGLYYQQIKRYLDFFPSKQILVTLYDDLKAHPDALISSIYTFLGVDSSFNPSSLTRKENAKKPLPKYKFAYNFLRSIYGQLAGMNHWVKPLVDELKRKGLFNVFYNLMRGEEPPKPSNETLRSLEEFYREDVEKLSKLLNRDLDFWLEGNYQL